VSCRAFREKRMDQDDHLHDRRRACRAESYTPCQNARDAARVVDEPANFCARHLIDAKVFPSMAARNHSVFPRSTLKFHFGGNFAANRPKTLCCALWNSRPVRRWILSRPAQVYDVDRAPRQNATARRAMSAPLSAERSVHCLDGCRVCWLNNRAFGASCEGLRRPEPCARAPRPSSILRQRPLPATYPILASPRRYQLSRRRAR